MLLLGLLSEIDSCWRVEWLFLCLQLILIQTLRFFARFDQVSVKEFLLVRFPYIFNELFLLDIIKFSELVQIWSLNESIDIGEHAQIN
jgi:hypothetical protein